jgi:putative heme-binding domain-containing protein
VTARKLQADEKMSVDDRIAALDDDDPFVRQAAIAGLISSSQLDSVERNDTLSSRQRVGLLTAWRWLELASPERVSAAERRGWIEWGLGDDSQEVLMTAVRWATERGLTQYLETIRSLLQRRDLSPRTFSAVIASIAYLETGSASRGRRDPQRERLLYQYAENPEHSPETRALAIRMLPAEAEKPTSDELAEWIANSHDRKLGIEIVRLLSERGDQGTLDALASIAKNEAIPEQTRADALASLSQVAGQYARVLHSLSLPSQPAALRQEAKRMTRRTWLREPQRPAQTDLDAWAELVSAGGDRDAGRRVFFRATCANCHAYQGRGATTGPDLSTLSGQMTAKRLMESILEPSKEIGPLYVPWQVLTSDGQILTGLKLDASGVGQSVRFQGADGMIFDVPLEEIEQQEPIRQSIMPTGLEQTMSIEELRDLAAFLIGDNGE